MSIQTATVAKESVDNVRVFWFDEEPPEDLIREKLQAIPVEIHYCKDKKSCIDNLSEHKSKKGIVVVTIKLAQDLIPVISKYEKIELIYIFDEDSEDTKYPIPKSIKIKRSFSDIVRLCETLQSDVERYDPDYIPTSCAAKGKLDTSFMYTQLFKEILINMEHDADAHIRYAETCPEEDKHDEEKKKYFNDFRSGYKKKKAIHWYTKEGFLYNRINEAFRLLKGDVIFKMGFFIRHLHEQLTDEHEKQFRDKVEIPPLYRGQGFSKGDFKKLEASVDGLYAFNSFLSTSRSRDVADEFLTRATQKNPIGVMFILTVDPKTPSVPFADVMHLSKMPHEKEVIFSMHSVFRVNQITKVGNQENVYEVKITLTNETDKELEELKEQIERDLQGGTPLQRLGHLLMKINEVEQAKSLYETVLSKKIDKSEKAYCYHQLGLIDFRNDQYENAVRHFENALEIHEKLSSKRESDLAALYINLGSAYLKLADFPKALEFYKKAEPIQKKDKTKVSDVATTHSNIGTLHLELGQYKEAEEQFRKALTIFQEILPARHKSLMVAESNVAAAQYKSKEYKNALELFRKTMEKTEDLPKKDLSKPIAHSNVAATYVKMSLKKTKNDHDNNDEVQKSLEEAGKRFGVMDECFKNEGKASEESLSCLIIENNRGLFHLAENKLDEAIESFELARQIGERLKLKDHPIVATICQNRGVALYNSNKFVEAKEYFDEAKRIREKILDVNHPDRKRIEKWCVAVRRKLTTTN